MLAKARKVENRNLFLKQLVIYLQRKDNMRRVEHMCLNYFYGFCLKIDSTWLPAMVASASLADGHRKHGSPEGQLWEPGTKNGGQGLPEHCAWHTRQVPWEVQGQCTRAVTGGHKKKAWLELAVEGGTKFETLTRKNRKENAGPYRGSHSMGRNRWKDTKPSCQSSGLQVLRSHQTAFPAHTGRLWLHPLPLSLQPFPQIN